MGDSHSASNKTLVNGCTVGFARLPVTLDVLAMVWYSVFLPPVHQLIEKFEVENMKKRTTKNIQPEPVLNSEQQTIDTTSRQTIANTHVACCVASTYRINL
jgi:hypothetical protein